MLEFLNRVTFESVEDYDIELFKLADGSQLCDLTVTFGDNFMPPDEHTELLEIIRDMEKGCYKNTILGSQVYDLVDNKSRLTVLYRI